MGCTSGKTAKKGIKLTPEIKLKMQQATQRTVSLFPYQDFRLTKIDYQKIITQSEPWIDTYFRPDKSSILDPSIPTPGRLKEWETFTWKRPKDVYGKGNYDLYKTIGPSDIRQGACGDCYFLSSIASLAENPDRVKAIFINKEINKAGCYAMNMYVNGEPQVIVVDDYFPFNERKNDWAFSRSSQEKELWVLLLEKAWAKIHGSYQRIEAGTTGEALPALTGAPSDFFYHSEAKNKEDVWNKIKEADQKNQIIATAVSSQRQGKSSSEMQSVGLVDAHAYSLISTHEVQDNAGKTIRLLKIRNPWGFKEWTGDWSDKSTKWTQDIKDELGFEDKDDGVFYISFDDYLNFFYITTICKYVQDNDLTVMPDEHAQNEYCIQKIVVHKDQLSLISIMVSQLHARIADLQMKGQYRYAPLKLILMKNVQTTGTSQNEPASDQLIFIDGAYICYQHAHIQLPKLTQGDYYVIFKADWLNDFHQERKLVMSIYAPDPFKIEKVSSQSFSYEFLGEIEDMLSNRIDEGFQYQLPEYDVDGIEEYNREQRKGIQALCIKDDLSILQLQDNSGLKQIDFKDGFNQEISMIVELNDENLLKILNQQLIIKLELEQHITNSNKIRINLETNSVVNDQNDDNFIIINENCPPVNLCIEFYSNEILHSLPKKAIDRLYVDRGCIRKRNFDISSDFLKQFKFMKINITPYI